MKEFISSIKMKEFLCPSQSNSSEFFVHMINLTPFLNLGEQKTCGMISLPDHE